MLRIRLSFFLKTSIHAEREKNDSDLQNLRRAVEIEAEHQKSRHYCISVIKSAIKSEKTAISITERIHLYFWWSRVRHGCLRTSDRRHWCGNPFSLAETQILVRRWGIRIATPVCALAGERNCDAAGMRGNGLPQTCATVRKHPCRTRLHQKYKCIRSVIEIAVFSDLMALLITLIQ